MADVPSEVNKLNEAPKNSAPELSTSLLGGGNKIEQLNILKAVGQGNGTEMHQFPSADQLLQQFNKDESKMEASSQDPRFPSSLQDQQQFADRERDLIKGLSKDELQTVGKITEDLSDGNWKQLGDIASQFKDNPERLGTLVQMTQLDLERQGLSDKFDLGYSYDPDIGHGAQGTLSVHDDSGNHYYRTDKTDPSTPAVNSRVYG